MKTVPSYEGTRRESFSGFFFYQIAQVQPKSKSQELVKGSGMFLRCVLVHQLLIKSLGDDLAAALV